MPQRKVRFMLENSPEYAYLLTYSRCDRMTWLGHLDMKRIFERAFLRADLPLAFSGGYHPHPCLVFALPIALGMECRGDLAELMLRKDLPGEQLALRINQKLPQHLRIEAVKRLPPHKKSLMSAVHAAAYRIQGADLGTAFAALQALPQPVYADKMSKGNMRKVDIFSLIEESEIISPHEFTLRCRAGSSENLRPDLVLQAVEKYLPAFQQTAQDARIIREALYLDALE